MNKEYQDYILQTPMNIYGFFIPAGTEFRQVNADWYHPIVNDARCPFYAVHFTSVINNPTYFQPK